MKHIRQFAALLALCLLVSVIWMPTVSRANSYALTVYPDRPSYTDFNHRAPVDIIEIKYTKPPQYGTVVQYSDGYLAYRFNHSRFLQVPWNALGIAVDDFSYQVCMYNSMNEWTCGDANPVTITLQAGIPHTVTASDVGLTLDLAIDNVGSADVLGVATDSWGWPLYIEAFDQGQYGTVHENNGELVYSFNTSWCQVPWDANNQVTDTFTFTVGDGTGLSDTATVTVTLSVPAHSVTITDSNELLFVPNDNILAIDALAAATDSWGCQLQIEAFDQGKHGDVNQDDDQLIYKFTAELTGLVWDAAGRALDAFTYTIGDGHGLSDTATVTVTLQRSDPHIIDAPDLFVNLDLATDDSVRVDVLAHATDSWGHQLDLDTFDAVANYGDVTLDGTDLLYTVTADLADIHWVAGATEDEFSYTVATQYGETATGRVVVRLERPAPPAAAPGAPPPVATDEDVGDEGEDDELDRAMQSLRGQLSPVAFHDHTPVTRAEWTAVVCVPEQLQSGSPEIDGHPYRECLVGALLRRWLIGYPDGLIRPDRPITEQELAAVMVRALGVDLSPPSDDNRVSDWARQYWATALRIGIVLSSDDPQGYVTEAVARRLLERLRVSE